MKKYKRIFIIVLDSLGIGEMKDSPDYGDVGVNTLGHIAEQTKNFHIPNLQKLGIANLCDLSGVGPVENPLGKYAKLKEKSVGKDTMTGHWELMGIHTTQPFKTFTETGFPKELIDELSKRTGRTIIGNKSASGTEILEELAEEEIAKGHLIVYTSADSVLQICGNEETMGLETLYHYCEIARELTMKDEWKVGRVIARPFVGESGHYTRTPRRHDFSLLPPAVTMLDQLKAAGKDVIAVGKIQDIFVGKGITEHVYTSGNAEGIQRTLEYLDKDFEGLCFINLVDYDMLYGHRRDVDGYAKALAYFDEKLPEIQAHMRPEDILMITADHGCDPAYTRTTDHTREYTPFLMYGAPVVPGNRGTRSAFSDIGATVLDYFGIQPEFEGTSVLNGYTDF